MNSVRAKGKGTGNRELNHKDTEDTEKVTKNYCLFYFNKGSVS